MLVRPLGSIDRTALDAVAVHPLQSYAWGEFRGETGQSVERVGFFDQGKLNSVLTVTFHKVPKTSYTIGYVPRGSMPDETMLATLRALGEKYNAISIKLEPNVSAPVANTASHEVTTKFLLSHGCVVGKPLFTPYTFVLSLEPSEEELLANMHQKTRYNINVAIKKGVQVVEDSTEGGLEEYFTLLEETTKRQGFYAHDREYYQKLWKILSKEGIAHIFKAVYEGKTLGIWVVFVFNKTIYYPYGASSRENREVMGNNLLAWEVIKFGKKMGCTKFDMWGSLGPEPNPKDPWFGFHKFKEGYGGTLMQFIGTYDLVLNPRMYGIVQKLDSIRWKVLRIKSKFGL